MSNQTIPTPTCDYDVAIIGLGPTGATLGNLLAIQGLRVLVLVLERDKDIFALPRAVHFDGECMRVFQTIGIADALLPNLFVGPGMKFVNAQGQLLIDWPRPTHIGPHGWCASYKFHQPDLENALRERLAQQPNVEVRLRHEVFSSMRQPTAFKSASRTRVAANWDAPPHDMSSDATARAPLRGASWAPS